MSRVAVLWLLFGFGAAFSAGSAILIGLFVLNLADASALRSAPTCATPTKDPGSTCVSIFNGTATVWTPHSKSLDRVTITVQDTTVDVGYDCYSAPSACNGIVLKPGVALATAWWKGELVAIGAAESRPAAITDQNPEYQLRLKVLLFLWLAIPGPSLVLAGLLLWRAPMTISELVHSALSQWPEPPRPVDSGLIRRVALGYWTFGTYLAWFGLYLMGSIFLMLVSSAYALGLVLLPATLAVSFAANALIATGYLSSIVRDSERRTIDVQRIRAGRGKNGNLTQIWYAAQNGKSKTKMMAPQWTGHVLAGDRLDVLVDRSGRIVWVLSTPLDHAYGGKRLPAAASISPP